MSKYAVIYRIQSRLVDEELYDNYEDACESLTDWNEMSFHHTASIEII